MKVLVLTPWFPNHPHDQEGSFVLDSVESLCRLGHQVDVMVTRPYVPRVISRWSSRAPGTVEAEMSRRGFSLTLLHHASIPRNHLRLLSNWMYRARYARALARAIASQGSEVIHAHTELAGELACAIGHRLGIAVVTTLHGINDAPRYLRGWGQPGFLARALSSPDRLVLVGAPLLDFARRHGATSATTRVVANGFRTGAASPWRERRVLQSPSVIQIASVSNLVCGKGIDLNLAALRRAEDLGFEDWHYHVLGDGAQRRALEAQARELQLAHKVSFHGRCPHDQVFALLSRCDVFSLPSAPEAFGVAYLEAMACGLLAIGVAGQGPAAFIEDEGTGLLVAQGDIEELAARLMSIAAARPHYAAVAEHGREHVWRHLTWESHARSLTRVFEEALMTSAAKATARGVTQP